MRRASTARYDRFKTVVAVVLGIILLLMLLRGCATNVVPTAPKATPSAAGATAMPPSAVPPTGTAPVASPTASLTPTAVLPTAEATETPATADVTATSSPAATELPTNTPEQATATSVQNASCNTIAATRLSVGQKARVIQRLNLRSAASIQASIIQVNPVNTQVEIIGGPTCEPVGANAYLWWQLRLADGTEGWSAESPLNSTSYFLEPVP